MARTGRTLLESRLRLMRHELKGLKNWGLLLLPLGGAEKVQAQAYALLRRTLCTPQQCLPPGPYNLRTAYNKPRHR